MTIMRIAHTLRAAALVVAFAGSAHAATRWVVLNGNTHTCFDAQHAAASRGLPALASPFLMRLYEREHPGMRYQETDVYRDSAGQVWAVFVKTSSGVISFFTTWANCQSFAAKLGSLSDLK